MKTLMKKAQRGDALRTLWRGGYFGIYLLSIVLCYPLYKAATWRPGLWSWVQRTRRWCSNRTLNVLGVRTVVEQRAALDWKKPYVICPNHASYIDISAILSAIPGTYAFMSKADVAKLPLIGIFSFSVDIPTSRENARQAMGALEAARQRLQSGQSVVIFPEGAFYGPPENLWFFRNGAFKLAIKEQVPVLPVTILNTWNVLPDRVNQGGSGQIRVIIHEPISTVGMKVRHNWITTEDVRNLRQQTFDVINAELQAFCQTPSYRNRWTSDPLGPFSVPAYQSSTKLA